MLRRTRSGVSSSNNRDLLDRVNSAGELLSLIRAGTAVTRADLARHTGLARSTVAQRVDVLLDSGLVLEAGGTPSTGGRPATMLAFNHQAGVVLVADLGATHARLALTDLAGTPLAEVAGDLDIALGPQEVLKWVSARFDELLEQTGTAAADVRGIGIGVPGPVEFDTGRPVNPPIMPGWDGFDIPAWFAEHHHAPVLVDNDVNIMARGEHWVHWRDTPHLLFVKVGTGIGCGIVADCHIHRGARGAAGDIGHIRATSENVICACGNIGCLEAVAGGHALATRLAATGVEASNSRDVVRLVHEGNVSATQMVRAAGRTLGEVLAGTVNFFNPAVIVIGGDIAEAHAQLLAGVREGIFSRSLPLATRDLRIVPCRLGDRAGVIGAAITAIEQVLSPAAVDQSLQAAAA
jgi:predicted NBD/HSP70 family sugar kinase